MQRTRKNGVSNKRTEKTRKRNYLVNFGYVNLASLGILLLGIVISIAFARLTSKETFGNFRLLIALLSTLSFVSLPGFHVAIIQSVARGYDLSYKKAVRIRFTWSVIGIPLLIAGSFFFFVRNETMMGISLILCSFFFPFLFALNSWSAYLHGKENFRSLMKWTLFQEFLISVSLLLAIIFFNNNIIFIIIAYLLPLATTNLIFFLRSVTFIQNKEHDTHINDYGWFLSKIAFLGLIASNIDKILLGMFIGAEELAIYVIISLIAIKLKDFLKTSISIFLPVLSKGNSTLIELLKQHRINLIIIHSLLMIIVVLYYHAIPYVNLFLFGISYSAYSYLSQIFSITILFAVPQIFMNQIIQSRKDKISIIVTNPFFYVIRIAANIILANYFGLIGIVIAFNLSQVLGFVLYLFSVTYIDLIKKNRENLENFM